MYVVERKYSNLILFTYNITITKKKIKNLFKNIKRIIVDYIL